ncbi:MAG: translocation/assembly module TamB domain-containing protein [Gammaproteobacteria bacterium]
MCGFAVVAFFILLVFATVYSQTEHFRELLRVQLVRALGAKYPGDFELGRISGSIWHDTTVSDVTLRYRGVELLRTGRIEAAYDLFQLVTGDLRLSRLRISRPLLRVSQDAEGNWDLLQALASEGKPPAVYLDRVFVEGGDITLKLNHGRFAQLHFGDFGLQSAIEIQPEGVAAKLDDLHVRVSADGLPPLQINAALAFEGISTPATVTIKELRLKSPLSSLRANGTITDLEQVNIALILEKLAAAELSQFVPGLLVKSDVRGRVEFNGLLADLKTQAALSAAEAHIRAHVQTNLSQSVPSFVGDLTLSRFSVEKLIDIEGVAGTIDGRVNAQGRGGALEELGAEAALKLDNVSVSGWQLGKGKLNASLARSKANFSAEIKSGLGRALLDGNLELKKTPAYELSLWLQHLDIKKIAAAAKGEKPLVGALNLKAEVKGQGLSWADMQVGASVDVLSSKIGPVALQRGRLVARAKKGRLSIIEGRLISEGTSLDVQGEIGIGAQQKGALSYRLDVRDIAPWLSLVGETGSGTVQLNGQASGRMQELALRGEFSAQGLRWKGNTLDRAALSFSLEDLGQTWPRGEMTARLTGIETGVSLARVNAAITLPRGKAETASLVLDAQEADGGTHSLRAQLARASPGELLARLSDLRLSLPRGVWQLDHPASAVTRGNAFAINRLTLSSGEQRVLIDGGLSLAGPQSINMRLERFDVANLQALLSPRISGRLASEITIAGSAEMPKIEATMDIADLGVAGHPLGELKSSFDYRQGNAKFDLNLRRDIGQGLIASGEIPMVIAWDRGWRGKVVGGGVMRISSSRLDLGAANAFALKGVKDIAGKLKLDLRVRGALSRPQANGTFTLENGGVDVPALGLRLSPISLRGGIDPAKVSITELRAKAREGEIRGWGTISLRDYLPETASFSLTAQRWPAIWTQRYQVEIGADLNAQGPFAAPEIKGLIDIHHARLRPDLALLEHRLVKRDDTIIVIREQSPRDRSMKQQQPSLFNTRALQALALDLTIRLQRDIRVRHPNAHLELAGQLKATKEADTKPSLAGAIHLARGWAGFQGRRFTIDKGEVVFDGAADINPRLDIVGQHRAGEYTVQASIAGTAAKPSLRLQSDPPLDQADILAVLLFGKPASALEQGEKLDLQRNALAITSGYAAATIGKSVTRALGLERLGVNLEDLDFSGGRLGLSRYITPKARLSFSQDLVGKEGEQISIEYQLSPSWGIETTTRSTGNSGVDIIWRKLY